MRSLVLTASASLLVAHSDAFVAPIGPQMRTASVATAHQLPAIAKVQPKWRTAAAMPIKMAEEAVVDPPAPAVEAVPEETTTWEEPAPVQDALAGLTVAFSLLSKAIACSAIVGVSPLVGLWSSVFMGVLTPLMGARPGVISGTAAVVIVPLSGLTMGYGVEYMAPCIIVSALLQFLFGFFNLAKTAKFVTDQVLSGFLNGLGAILLMSQLKVFTGAAAAGTLAATSVVAGLCFAIIQYLPKFTKAVPSSLAGLLVASGVASVFNLPLKTLAQGAPAGTFAGGLSTLPSMINLPELFSMLTSLSVLKLVTPVAISIMIIALVETLLAGKVVDELTGGEYKGADYDVPTRSVLGMSFGNTVSALFGGFGGCGLIPQTVLNIKSGGGGKYSSASYALAMAAFIVFFAPLVGQIPEAALAGVMLTVGADTVAWGETANSVKRFFKPEEFKDKAGAVVSRSTRAIELLILAGTSYVCYFGNLAVGIIGGILVQMALMKATKAMDKA